MWRLIVMISVFFVIVNTGQAQDSDWSYNAMRALFMKNDDGTVSLFMDWALNGRNNPQKIVIVIPIQSVPEIEIISNSRETPLWYLHWEMEPQVIEPYNPCGQLVWSDGWSGPQYTLDGSTELIKYDLIPSDEEALYTQLDDYGYVVDGDERLLLDQYVAQGNSFVLLDIQLNDSYAFSPTIKLTYKADDFILPFTLTKNNQRDYKPVWVYVLGDEPYQVRDYPQIEVDPSTFYNIPSILMSSGTEVYGNFDTSFHSNLGYRGAFWDLSQDYESFFVTEFVGSTDFISDEEFLWMKKYSYLTRIVGSFTVDTITQDLHFAPSPTQADVSNEITVPVDSLYYWGCSSHSLEKQDPPSIEWDSVFIDDEHVAYPRGWVISKAVGINGLPVTIFAPETVTLENLRGLFVGTYSNPMIFYISPQDLDYDENIRVYDLWREFIIYELGLEDKLQTQNSWQILDDALPEYLSINSVTRHYIYSNTSFHRGLYGIIYPHDENGLSILHDFPTRDDFYFYAHPKLKHTVFLGSMFNGMSWRPHVPVYFGFPDGWVEYMASQSQYEVIITPESEQDNPDAPRIYLAPLDWINQPDDSYRDISESIEEIAGLYQFNDNTIAQLEEAYQQKSISQLPPLIFEKDGRKGYVTFTRYYRLETSAPIEQFEVYADLLLWSAESLSVP